MNVPVIMSYLYPIIAVSYFVAMGISFLLYVMLKDKSEIMKWLSVYFFFSLFAFLILSLTTGERPLANFDVLRPWLVFTRMLQTASLWVTIMAIYHRIPSSNSDSDPCITYRSSFTALIRRVRYRWAK